MVFSISWTWISQMPHGFLDHKPLFSLGVDGGNIPFAEIQDHSSRLHDVEHEINLPVNGVGTTIFVQHLVDVTLFDFGLALLSLEADADFDAEFIACFS